jgi:hypothetical protein
MDNTITVIMSGGHADGQKFTVSTDTQKIDVSVCSADALYMGTTFEERYRRTKETRGGCIVFKLDKTIH